MITKPAPTSVSIALMLCLLMIFTLLSCSKETELSRSIFIEDKDHPGLPIYSEWGYNTFGAYYERAVLTQFNESHPGEFLVEDGTTTFSLDGRTNNYQTIRLEFVLPEYAPQNIDGLVSLHDTSFDLTNPQMRVIINVNGVTTEAEILEGELRFKRAQHLFVDGVKYQVILSGDFYLKFLLDGTPTTISDGRFDLGITNESFYFIR